MGQMDSGRGRDEFADLDLRDVIQDVADLYEPVTAEKQIAFTVKTTDLPTIRGDRDLIMEAVVNLVDNAVKFTGTGGRVTLSTVIEQGRPIVRVADNGPGIAPEERQAVLQRFFRSERTKSVVGSGLGLSLVDSIARLHGFSIVIRDADPGCMIDLVCGSQDVAAGGD
jgi:signal transduction histidine kinase